MTEQPKTLSTYTWSFCIAFGTTFTIWVLLFSTAICFPFDDRGSVVDDGAADMGSDPDSSTILVRSLGTPSFHATMRPLQVLSGVLRSCRSTLWRPGIGQNRQRLSPLTPLASRGAVRTCPSTHHLLPRPLEQRSLNRSTYRWQVCCLLVMWEVGRTQCSVVKPTACGAASLLSAAGSLAAMQGRVPCLCPG